MTVAEEARRLKDEEVLPLMHTLQLEHGGSTGPSNKHRLPLVQRLRALLQGFSPELLAIALVYFVQGMLKLSSLAVTFFLKDNLMMEPTQLALAETITAVPWTVKPLYGFITDSFPICGMRRRPYLVLAGLLGSVSWLCMAGLANSVSTALCFITAAALSTAFSDVVADSIVVQLARSSPGATEGALQSMCWSAHAVGRVLTAYSSGWLVGKVGPRPVFVATASFPLIVCASSCLIRESHSNSSTPQQAANTAEGCEAEQHQHLLGAHTEASNVHSLLMMSSVPEGTCMLLDRHHSGTLSSQGSSEVLQCQLQLTTGQLQHKHRHAAAMQQHDSQHSTPRHAAAGTAAAAGGFFAAGSAAAAADDAAVLPCSAGHTGSSDGQGGSGKQKPRMCLQQVWTNMVTSVRLFWNAVKQPHMLRPVVFLFLLQAMPQPDSAMFFFKTNKLGFDAEFFGRVKLVAALADLAGLAVYNAFLKAARLRPMLLWGSLLGCAVGLTPLLLVEGVNRKLGISDQLFALVDSALLASIGQVLMMPTLVLCARLCPEGVEATLYASLMSLTNAAFGVGSLLGALMTKLFGITSTNFTHLSVLLLTCNLMSLLPLPLVSWVPDSSANDAAAAAETPAATGADGQKGLREVEGMELGAATSSRV